MRLFVGIYPVGVEEWIKTHFQEYSVRAPHVTLSFLPNAHPDQVLRRLEGIIVEEFTIRIIRSGILGRVYCLFLEKNGALLRLKRDLDDVLPEYAEKRAFCPHITLSRRNMGDFRVLDANFKVDGFRLMKSELSYDGARHTLIRDFPSKTA